MIVHRTKHIHISQARCQLKRSRKANKSGH
jgi:hypothetical protein